MKLKNISIIGIPNFLKDKLKVNEDSVVKNLAILGVGTHLEIWAVEEFNKTLSNEEEKLLA